MIYTHWSWYTISERLGKDRLYMGFGDKIT